MITFNNEANGLAADIGGYFGLELPMHGDIFPSAVRYQSGRAALRAVLEHTGIERIFLPGYICDSVFQAATDAGAVVETYWLDDSLYPRGLPKSFPAKSVVLYVNYFGLCDANVIRLLANTPENHLIIDNCQALFTRPSNALATIYSPRKFVGIPDGGLLIAPGIKITEPEHEDMDSIGRMRHLLLRMAYTAQDGYHDYVESEMALKNSIPLRMSRLTSRILASIDVGTVTSQRRANFETLAASLGKYNKHKWKLDSESVPLCYPLVLDRDVESIKRSLVEKGIYIPTYWPEIKQSVRLGSIEHRLTSQCLAVPCDQRYSRSQMSHLSDEIIASFDMSE